MLCAGMLVCAHAPHTTMRPRCGFGLPRTEGFGAPFGTPPARDASLSPDWQRCVAEVRPAPADSGASRYGLAGGATWTLVEQSDTSVTLECAFPETHALSTMRRTFTGRGASVMVVTDVTARQDVTLPVGVDVPLALPGGPPGCAVLAPPDFEFGAVHPAPSADGGSDNSNGVQPSPGASFTTLASVPRRVAGGPGSHVGGADLRVDMSSLPLAAPVSCPLPRACARVACLLTCASGRLTWCTGLCLEPVRSRRCRGRALPAVRGG